MSSLIDMTGKKIGRLTVICREGTYQRPSGNKEPTWRCVCECGKEVVVHASNLKKRNTLSCGCLQGESRREPRRETEHEVRGEDAYVKSFDGAEVVVNSCDLDYVLSHRWHLNGHGYAVDEHGITMHRALMFPPDCMDVHHINGNKLDNRRSNLLMLTRSEHTALHNGETLANGVVVRSAKPMRVEVTTDDFLDLESARAEGCYRKHFFCPACDIEIGHQTFDRKRKFGQGTVLHSNRFPNCCPSCGERLRMEDNDGNL